MAGNRRFVSEHGGEAMSLPGEPVVPYRIDATVNAIEPTSLDPF